jgi:hypothetical protein
VLGKKPENAAAPPWLLIDQVQHPHRPPIMRLSTHEVIVPDMVGVLRGQSHDPSLSHKRPPGFCLWNLQPFTTPDPLYPVLANLQGLNMRNAITVSELLLASVVISDVTAAQTSAPQITITPTAAQNVITGPKRFTGFVRVQSLFDPTESEAVDIAKSANRQTKKSEIDIDRSSMSVREARANYFPQLSLMAQFGFMRPLAATMTETYRLPSGVSIRLVRLTSIAAKCSEAVSPTVSAAEDAR